MEKLVVACVQQRMRLPETLDDHRDDLRRFLRTAANKRARLVIFPELAGLMTAPPLLGGVQASLLKQADRARRRRATLWQKMSGSLAGTTARLLRIDLRRLLAGLIDVAASDLWDAYQTVYGGLAKEFDVTIVAPSSYLPDPLDGVIRNITVVFGPNGERLGYQSKVMLHREDEDLAQPGSEWRVIQTDVGRLGLMLGNDLLYPEVGRLLAYQGAEILVGQGAAPNPVLYEKLRSGMLARMQDNQLFGAISFLVGPNEFGRRRRTAFVGKSAILAPQELTPRYSGILVEMSNYRSESVLSAIWDFPALEELWESSDTPVRRQLPVEQAGQVLANLYQRLQRLPSRPQVPELPNPDAAPASQPALEATRSLDELPVLASVTARWPLDENERGETDEIDEEDPPLGEETGAGFLRSALNTPGEEEANSVAEVEEETQEMDALLQPSNPDEQDDPPDSR